MAALANDPQYDLALALYGESSLEVGVLLKLKIMWESTYSLTAIFQYNYHISDIRFSTDGNFIVLALQQKNQMNQMFITFQTPNFEAPTAFTNAKYQLITNEALSFERGGKIQFVTPDQMIFTSIASGSLVCDFFNFYEHSRSIIYNNDQESDLSRHQVSNYEGVLIEESEFKYSLKQNGFTTFQDLLARFNTSYCSMAGQFYNGSNPDQQRVLLILSSTESGDCQEAYLFQPFSGKPIIEYSGYNQQRILRFLQMQLRAKYWQLQFLDLYEKVTIENLTQVLKNGVIIVQQKDLDREFHPETQTLNLMSPIFEIQLSINTKNKCKDYYFSAETINLSFILDPNKKQQTANIFQLAGFQNECYNSTLTLLQNQISSTLKDHQIMIDTSKVGEFDLQLKLKSPVFDTFYQVRLTVLPCLVDQIIFTPIALRFEDQAQSIKTAVIYTTQVPSCQANISYRVSSELQEINSALTLVNDVLSMNLSSVDLIQLTNSTHVIIIEAFVENQPQNIFKTIDEVYINPKILQNAYQTCKNSFQSLKLSFEVQIDVNQSAPLLLPLNGLTDLKKVCNDLFFRLTNRQSFLELKETSLLLTLKDPSIAGVYKIQMDACKGQQCLKNITSFQVELTIVRCQVQQILLSPVALSFDSPQNLVQQTILQIQQVPSCMEQISIKTITEAKFPGTIVVDRDILSVDISKAKLEELTQSSYTFTIQVEAKSPTPVLVQFQGMIKISQNLLPPLEFIDELKDTQLAFNSTTIYVLPPSKYRLSDFEISINLDNNKFQDAISLDKDFQFIKISAIDPQVAGQTVYVTLILKDKNRESKYSFKVSVDDIPIIQDVFEEIEFQKLYNSTNATAENSFEDQTQEASQSEDLAAVKSTKQASIQNPQKAKNSEAEWVSDFWVPRPRSEPVKLNKFQVDYPLPKFSEVGQDGQFTIKFSKPLKQERRRLNSQIEPDFSKMVDVSIFKREGKISQTNLNFKWSIQQVSDDQLVIKMMFQDVFQLQDQENERYQLQVVFNGTFTAASGASIPKGTTILVNIPPQLPNTPVESTLKASTTSVQSGMNTLVILNFLLSFAMQVSLSLLWGMINCLQLFVHIPMLNINFPSNANTFMTKLINVASFDMFPMDKINQVFFNFTETEPLNDRIKELRYETRNTMVNLGSIWIFFILVPLKYILRIILIKLAYLTKLRWIKRYLGEDQRGQNQNTFLNAMQRLILESLMEIIISSFIGLYSKTSKTKSDSLAKLLAYLSLIAVTIFFAFGLFFSLIKTKKLVKMNRIYKRQRMLKYDKKQFENLNPFGRAERRPRYKRDLAEMKLNAENSVSDLQNFGAIFLEGLKVDSQIIICYNIFLSLRILAFILIAFFLAHSPVVQVQLYSLMSLITLCYLIHARPFQESADNNREIMNELGTFLISLQIYSFLGQLLSARKQYGCGWTIVVLVFIVISINMILIIYQNIILAKTNLLKYCRKLKIRKKKEKDIIIDVAPKNDIEAQIISVNLLKPKEELLTERAVNFNSSLYKENFKMNLIKCGPVQEQDETDLNTKETNSTPRSIGIIQGNEIKVSSFQKKVRKTANNQSNLAMRTAIAIEHLTRKNDIVDIFVDINQEDYQIQDGLHQYESVIKRQKDPDEDLLF